MKRKKLHYIVAVLLITFMILNPAIAQAATTATTIKLSSTEGDDITITSGSGKEVAIRKDMVIYNGYKITTGENSYVYLMLDKTKAIKLDQNTEISIEKEGRKKEICVETGEVFFNVSKKLTSKETLKVKTSNSTMGIRGTSGTVKVDRVSDTSSSIKCTQHVFQIFDGVGVVTYVGEKSSTQETRVLPGYQLKIVENIGKETSTFQEKIRKEDLSSFAIAEILKNDSLYERVNEDMSFTKEELADIFSENKKIETENLEKLKNQKTEIEKLVSSQEKKDFTNEITPTPAIIPAPTPEVNPPVPVPTPMEMPSEAPTDRPTDVPTPSEAVTDEPTDKPEPSEVVADEPTDIPTPSEEVTGEPTDIPELEGMLTDILIPDNIFNEVITVPEEGNCLEIDSAYINKVFEKYAAVQLSTMSQRQIILNVVGEDKLVIPERGLLVIPNNITICVRSDMINNGNILVQHRGAFQNGSHFINHGVIVDQGSILNMNYSIFENDGDMYVSDKATLHNQGKFRNSARFVVQGECNNYENAIFHNPGCLLILLKGCFQNYSCEVIQDQDAISRGGDVINQGTVIINGTFQNGSKTQDMEIELPSERACFVNNHEILGNIINFADAYLKNQEGGSISHLTNHKGIYENEGCITKLDGEYDVDNPIYLEMYYDDDKFPIHTLLWNVR